MGDEGTELSRNSPEKREMSKQRGTIFGTICDDPELQILINAWRALPPALRADILAMVRTSIIDH
jgi:hypothetical protein